MKKLTVFMMVCIMIFSVVFASCSVGKSEEPSTPNDEKQTEEATSEESGNLVINLWSFTDEIPGMVERYKELHPDFPYDFNITIIATTEGAYQPALDQVLAEGGPNTPDIYAVEAAFVMKYTQGDAADSAMTYKDLGIDVDSLVNSAEIATYASDIGTRLSDGQIVALPYQATGGGFIYRRSIAMDTWGTDDPVEIAAKIGPGWDQFLIAASELQAKRYAIVSGDGDVWHPIENASPTGWVVNGKLNIDPHREYFLDIAKTMKDNNYMNDSTDWQDTWFADMSGSGKQPVFGFFGPAWLINYVMADNAGDTYGDWALCEPTEPFSWGGTWVCANKDLNPEVKDAVSEIIEWITLDTSDDGLQYHWANGTLFEEPGKKDTVASGAVMEKSDGSLDFLGGQNMFDIFIEAGEYANGKILTQYDETINQYFSDYSTEYATGAKTKEEAIAAFKQQVADNLGIAID